MSDRTLYLSEPSKEFLTETIMPTLQALIFDVDGTLAETERDGHRVAFNHAFEDAGLGWHWSEELYGELLQVAGGKERIRFYIEQYAPSMPEVSDLTAFIADLHRVKTDHFKERVTSGKLPLRPGVRRLIAEAREMNIRLAIATTTRLENALAILETSLAPDAADWFELISAGDSVPRKKPASDVYDYVLDQLALPAKNCLAIEDTEHGVTAATGANIKTIVTVNDYTRTQDFSQAAMVLEHLGDPDYSGCALQGPSMPKGYFDLAIAEEILNVERF